MNPPKPAVHPSAPHLAASTGRLAWLGQRRAAVIACYDGLAPGYDDHDYPTGPQLRWVARLLGACPATSMVLDAACGTGRYFPMVAAAGHRVVGTDQSAGMLAQARTRGIAIALDQIGLQELRYPGAFDVVLCIDAMENIPPEDWPLVLANLHRAMRPGGLLYLTVEEVPTSVIEDAFAALTGRGLPAARGEVIDGNVAGHHYYPGRDRVTGWTQDAGLQILDEDFQQEHGWGYRHFLLHTAAGPEPARSLPILAADTDTPSAAQDRAKSRRTAPATPQERLRRH